jgi:chromosome segregation ATPase
MSSFAHENCDVAEGSSSAPASTAMTLWQKFANWQNEMEECRRNARNVRQQQEQCMAQIENLRAIGKEEQMKIEQFRQMHGTTQSSEAESSLGMLQDLQRRLGDADKEYRIAATSLQKIQQQSVAQTDQRHETMQQILSQSHQFRWDCQQLQQQLQTTLPAEEYLSTVNGFQDNWDAFKDVSSTAHSLRAALRAILAAQSEFFDVTAEDPWISKTLKDLEFFTTPESLEPEKEVDENDPSTWTFIHGNDADFHQVMAAYTRERKVLDATTQELQALQNKQEVLQSKAHDRNQRVSQLQEQLHRLHGDCSGMDAEINRYKHLISEDETLAHTYRESKCRPGLVLISLRTDSDLFLFAYLPKKSTNEIDVDQAT